MNFGYNIKIINRLYITPYVGYGWTNNIYQYSVSYKNYFLIKNASYINFGISSKLFVSKHLGLQLGVGTFEKYKIGLVLK